MFNPPILEIIPQRGCSKRSFKEAIQRGLINEEIKQIPRFQGIFAFNLPLSNIIIQRGCSKRMLREEVQRGG